MAFGRYIRRSREGREMTLTELARRVDVSIAYLSRIRTTSPPQASANPAEYSCQNDFDGATYFGNSAAGGGWTDPSQPVFVVMIPCTFADGSSIDAFGLWYHANGVIRGADLAPLMAYQPGNDLPAVYASEGR